MASHDLAILGGGVAGLTASLTCGAPVYEAAAEVGGVAATDTHDGFAFDRGIHILQSNNKEILDLLAKVGVEFDVIERNAHIHAFGKDTAYPFQINSTNLPILRRAQCVWGFLRRSSMPEPTNYAEWIYRSVGRGFADTFLIPYSEKFWGVHPREMSFEWTGNRIPKAEFWQVLRGAFVNRQTKVGTNATFRYPRGSGGYGTVPTKLAAAAGAKVHTSYKAERIDTRARRVFFTNGETLDYRVLISTIPLPVLCRIATDVPADVTKAIADLQTTSIVVVNLGIATPNLTTKHWIHFPEKSVSFFRMSFPHNLSKDVVPPGMSSVACEVSYPSGSKPDCAALIERVKADLVRVGVLSAHDKVVTAQTFDIPFGYCIFTDARRAALATIFGWLETIDIIPSGRYGLWSYFWSDEAMVSGIEAAQRAKTLLESEDGQSFAASSAMKA